MSSLNTKCLFQKLRKLEEKRVRYLSHLDNYRLKIHNCNGINKDTFNYLFPQDPRMVRFYLLPKIHKAGNPGRPIVSGNDLIIPPLFTSDTPIGFSWTDAYLYLVTIFSPFLDPAP